jgi:hypothetical protein
MKSHTFKGKNEDDLEKQLWDWRTANPKAIVKQKHPIERLPLNLAKPSPGEKMLG